MNLKPNALNFDEVAAYLGAFRIGVPRAIVEELIQLANKKGLRSRKAKFALEIIKKGKYKIIDEDLGRGDISLMNIAARDDVIVATLDREVMENLKRMGKKIVTLRKERLVLV